MISKPCKHGHICGRYKNGRCIECARKTSKECARRYKAANPEKIAANRNHILELKRAWRKANPEKYKAQKRRWEKNNPDKKKAIDSRAGRKWRAANKHKSLEICRRWRKANPDKYRAARLRRYKENPEKFRASSRRWLAAHKDERRASMRRWCQANKGKRLAQQVKRQATKIRAIPKWADLEAIKRFYENRPKGFHVDHIIPLTSDKVCGLHVLENLQYLTAADNIRKHNKLVPETVA